VLEEISARFPASLKLVIASVILALIVAIPLGVISATKPHSIIDKLVMVGVVGGISMPVFWLASLLILLFSVHLHLLPVCGYGGVKNMVLPAITLGAGMAAFTTMITKSSMLEVLRQDYITAARAKGLSERVIIGKHALKNALIPVITIVGWQLMMALQGSVMVEMIFAWPGVGELMVKAASGRDFPVIQGCVLLFGISCAVINLVIDISYAYLDPRIRYEKV
jgi:peptide/nickel transport system permease protein